MKFRLKNTIFKKLVTVFISLLVLSYIITGGFLYYFLNDYGTTQKVSTLKRNAEVIKETFTVLYGNMDGTSLKWFQNFLNQSSVLSNSMIWIVDNKGHIVYSEPSMPESLTSKYIDDSKLAKLPDVRQYADVMDGGNETLVKTGDFFGFFADDAFKNDGSSWVTVQMPIKVIPSSGKQITIAAVYLHTPVPEVQRLQFSVFRLFMISGGLAILIAILLVYVFSVKFTRPLKQINQAAKKIAGGEFSNRLVVNSKDEIGQLADSFNHMLDDLQELEEMRRGFIANVSHELRTPMTSIRGFVEGILDGTIPPDRQRNYLFIVKDEAIRLSRLVSDLLDLAKMEAGEMNLNIKQFNINELIRICVIKLETLITSKNLEIEANFAIDNLFVTADKDSIERVIINLLHNAVKFSNENGKIILETVKNKEKVLISVQDTGIGISEEDIKRIWDRFYKTDKSRGKDKTGTGLGLAIVKNIINEHNQDIWVESKVGEGTKFTFTLDYFKNSFED
ncbi:signal transduction histidine kinase [Ruminiclostridium sufflavum DSM 19573]|uniref:histidine kinase n=1 Tax=Ruminiclostridium sufflavum DSM 19573 TaxID=1121337 RepID=A0A318XKE5_9FIRM|nr:ATP-binding protein [Ruminiclostridium sufflavum]PYG86833.1 signal transduction histidine kinase [Ruminiclostridium sufflavum DSM 19573]